MQYPSEIWDIVREAVARCKGSEAAFRHAVKNVRAHPAFASFVDCLIDGAVQELVYQIRHKLNGPMRATAVAVPKVVSGNSPALQEIADLYLYRIGGNVLGNMTREQLESIAPAEAERASGHMFNCRLCERLIPLVPKGKTVQQAVPVKKLRSVWREVGNGGKAEAA